MTQHFSSTQVNARPVYTYHASQATQWHVWRVPNYVGKMAQLRFSDQTGSYGFEFDHLQFGPPAPQGIQIVNNSPYSRIGHVVYIR